MSIRSDDSMSASRRLTGLNTMLSLTCWSQNSVYELSVCTSGRLGVHVSGVADNEVEVEGLRIGSDSESCERIRGSSEAENRRENDEFLFTWKR